MAMAVGPSGGIKNEINVTPLVDVVLVLLIIFMVVTPMLQRGKDVRLPKSHEIEKESQRGDPLIVSITPDKHLYVEHDRETGILSQPGALQVYTDDDNLDVCGTLRIRG